VSWASSSKSPRRRPTMGWAVEADEEASPTSHVAGGGERRSTGASWRRKVEHRLASSRRCHARADGVGGERRWRDPPPLGTPPARPLLGHDGTDAAPLLLVVDPWCSPATLASSSSPTSTAAAEARGAAPARHQSVARRWFNSSPELSKGWWRRLGFAAEGVRVRPVSAARAGTCTVLNGPSMGAREIFLWAKPFTGSATRTCGP
jgi:hypothetical protein